MLVRVQCHGSKEPRGCLTEHRPAHGRLAHSSGVTKRPPHGGMQMESVLHVQAKLLYPYSTYNQSACTSGDPKPKPIYMCTNTAASAVINVSAVTISQPHSISSKRFRSAFCSPLHHPVCIIHSQHHPTPPHPHVYHSLPAPPYPTPPPCVSFTPSTTLPYPTPPPCVSFTPSTTLPYPTPPPCVSFTPSTTLPHPTPPHPRVYHSLPAPPYPTPPPCVSFTPSTTLPHPTPVCIIHSQHHPTPPYPTPPPCVSFTPSSHALVTHHCATVRMPSSVVGR